MFQTYCKPISKPNRCKKHRTLIRDHSRTSTTSKLTFVQLIPKGVQPLIVTKNKTGKTKLASEQSPEQQPMRNYTTVMAAVIGWLLGSALRKTYTSSC